MPIYEYRCPNGHTFETFQKMSEAPVESCTICGAAPVEKVLFPVAVHFKGSGFYSTDYGKGGRKQPAKETSDSGTDSKPSADKPDKGTGDKKPAADAGS